jgi:hypothetical protein
VEEVHLMWQMYIDQTKKEVQKNRVQIFREAYETVISSKYLSFVFAYPYELPLSIT